MSPLLPRTVQPAAAPVRSPARLFHRRVLPPRKRPASSAIAPAPSACSATNSAAAPCPSSSRPAKTGPQTQPKKSRARERIVALRKRNYSVYEISARLREEAMDLSATAVREVLTAEGFAPLPRRLDEERCPSTPARRRNRWPMCAPSSCRRNASPPTWAASSSSCPIWSGSRSTIWPSRPSCPAHA